MDVDACASSGADGSNGVGAEGVGCCRGMCVNV